jgi:hypothetical protein
MVIKSNETVSKRGLHTRAEPIRDDVFDLPLVPQHTPRNIHIAAGEGLLGAATCQMVPSAYTYAKFKSGS